MSGALMGRGLQAGVLLAQQHELRAQRRERLARDLERLEVRAPAPEAPRPVLDAHPPSHRPAHPFTTRKPRRRAAVRSPPPRGDDHDPVALRLEQLAPEAPAEAHLAGAGLGRARDHADALPALAGALLERQPHGRRAVEPPGDARAVQPRAARQAPVRDREAARAHAQLRQAQRGRAPGRGAAAARRAPAAGEPGRPVAARGVGGSTGFGATSAVGAENAWLDRRDPVAGQHGRPQRLALVGGDGLVARARRAGDVRAARAVAALPLARERDLRRARSRCRSLTVSVSPTRARPDTTGAAELAGSAGAYEASAPAASEIQPERWPP